MLKTNYCGDLRAENVGQTVTLAGWVHRRRDHGGLIFIDLRDKAGIVQVVINPQISREAHDVVSDARAEYVLQPPFGENGHYVFTDGAGARSWVPAVDRFLRQHGVPFSSKRAT